MDSERDFSSNSDYDEFANEIPFVGDILQLFQFEPVFTAAEIRDEKRKKMEKRKRKKKRPSW